MGKSEAEWFFNVGSDCPRVFAGHSPFFLALSFIIVTRKAETLAGMCHCGLHCACIKCMCVYACKCVCVCACNCRPVPVFVERRQADEAKTKRHVSFMVFLPV